MAKEQGELTSTEQQELIKLMGTVYGESRKLDEFIISPTNTLTRDKSQNVKRAVEDLLTKTARPVQPVHPSISATPPVIEAVKYTDPQPQSQQQPPVVVDQHPSNQLEFDFNVNEKDELFKTINRIDSKLDKILKLLKEQK